jgi:hypothetical protein
MMTSYVIFQTAVKFEIPGIKIVVQDRQLDAVTAFTFRKLDEVNK